MGKGRGGGLVIVFGDLSSRAVRRLHIFLKPRALDWDRHVLLKGRGGEKAVADGRTAIFDLQWPLGKPSQSQGICAPAAERYL